MGAFNRANRPHVVRHTDFLIQCHLAWSEGYNPLALSFSPWPWVAMLVYLIVITSLASVAAMQGTSLLQVSASRQRAPDLHWCWDLIPSDTEVFLLHIGKAAGCSTVADLSKIVDRNNIWSNQGCLSWAHSMQDSWHVRFNVTATMLRKPEDLVLSMYYQCKTSGGKGSIMWNYMAKLGFAPDQPGYNMPDTFQAMGVRFRVEGLGFRV